MSGELDRLDVLLDIGRFDEALRQGHRLLAGGPNDPEVLTRVSLAHHGLGQHAEALDAAQRVVALLPNSAIGHICASEALVALKRIREAIAAARRAVHLEPGNMYAHAQLAEAASLRRRRRREAWAAATEAVELEPDVADAHATMGAVALRQGRHGAAEAAFLRALQLDPTNHAANHNLALLRVRRGEFVEGAQDLGTTAAQHPNAPESAAAFEVVALLWLRRTHLGMWAVWYPASKLSGLASTHGAEVYWFVRGLILLGLAVFLWWTRRTVVRLGGRLRRVVWTVMRRSMPTMIWFLSVGAGALGLLWAMLWPWWAVASLGLRLTLGGLLIGVVASWVGVARR